MERRPTYCVTLSLTHTHTHTEKHRERESSLSANPLGYGIIIIITSLLRGVLGCWDWNWEENQPCSFAF